MGDGLGHDRYSAVAVVLHWTIAILIIGQIAGGLYMHRLPNTSAIKFDLYQLHKSFGLTILALMLIRLGWRLMHRPPGLPSAMPPWQKWIARATHWTFYALLILTPLVGWAMVSVSPKDIPTEWFGAVHVPHLPFFDGVIDRARVEDLYKEIHEYLAFAILYLLALHVGAALKHRFVDRDNVLQSMALRSSGYWISTFAILGVLGALSGAYFLMPAGAARASVEAPTQNRNAEANWTVDYEASRLVFVGEEKGRRFEGAFSGFNAAIYFDPDNLAASWINVGVATASAVTEDELRDATLPGAEWFAVRDFPVATFVATEFRSLGGNAYEANGVLTIKDLSRDVVLSFTLDIDGEDATARGNADLIRTDFGLGAAPEWLDEEQVALEVRVEFEIVATRKD